MAINPESEFAGKILPASAEYPYGQARNVTISGDGTGTPFVDTLVNDIFGYQQALLSKANIVPSGTPDEVGASQYLDATLDAVGTRAGTIFSTVAEMIAGNPTDGENITYKVGQTLSVNGENDATVGYIVVNTVESIDLGGGLYAKLLASAGATKTVAPNGTDSLLEYANFNDAIGILSGKMAAGEAVTIACYGDSTTDGNQTTSWVANPTDGGGDAIGNSDHNLTAPSAFPAVLQSVLREIHGNSNIDTYNAGYSGKRMDDGWAVANYSAAVIDNPFYGTPDITLIAFGLNDIQTGGSQIDDHVEQTRILVRRIIDDGTVPVLLTSDAEFRNGTNGSIRDHKEARRQIDAAKLSLGLEFGIPVWDIGLVLKDWIENNTDGYRWSQEQSDGLHFEDNGHALKASYFATHFFNDTATFEGGTKYINTWNSETAYIGNYSTRYQLPNNKQGGNIFFPSAAPTSTDMMTVWLWNTSPNAYLLYLGIDNESGDVTNPATSVSSTVLVTDQIEQNTITKTCISYGDFNPDYRRSDEQFIHGKLKMGLNKIVYNSGDKDFAFYGSFKIVESTETLPTNVLAETGRLSKEYLASTGIHSEPLAEGLGLTNTAGGFVGDVISLSFKAVLPRDGGIILLNGQGFNGTQAAVDNNLQSGLLALRRPTDELGLYSYKIDDTGTATFVLLATTAALVWTNNIFEGRVEVSRVVNDQVLDIYDSWSGGSNIATATLPLTSASRWSGQVGGLYYHSDSAAVDGVVELLEMSINR